MTNEKLATISWLTTAVHRTTNVYLLYENTSRLHNGILTRVLSQS